MRVLIVEDEKHIYSPLKEGLEGNNYAVDIAIDGEEGLSMAQSNEYDVIILDLNLPKIDGIEVCQILRKEKNNTPIIMLTARSQLDNKIEGLEIGADDYMTKPFSFKELLLRLNNLIKRSKTEIDDILKVADIELDSIKRSVCKAEQEVELNKKEFGILEYLMRNKGNVVSQEELIEHVWSSDEVDMFSNTIRTQILNLRNKVDPEREIIMTVKGVGYKVE